MLRHFDLLVDIFRGATEPAGFREQRQLRVPVGKAIAYPRPPAHECCAIPSDLQLLRGNQPRDRMGRVKEWSEQVALHKQAQVGLVEQINAVLSRP